MKQGIRNMSVAIAVLKETLTGERRVALTPDASRKLRALGAQVIIQRGAGAAAGFDDGAYTDAMVADDAAQVLQAADVLLCVNPPTLEHIAMLREGAVIIGQLQPHADHGLQPLLLERRISAFALELLPRTTRAQSMDVLSSQASVGGYKAVLVAASAATKFFPMLTTAAGTMRPSKVLVIGAGVAGLQAIATARRLGGQVEGFDVRPETREQIESLGARFLDLQVAATGTGGYARALTDEEQAQQQAALAKHLRGIDVVISTAAVPGRPAPRIISAQMLAGMKNGAVVVDMAADSGGNCETSIAGETVVSANGVQVIGTRNLPATMPEHASQMYATNLLNFLQLSLHDGELALDWADELVSACCVSHAGQDGPPAEAPTEPSASTEKGND